MVGVGVLVDGKADCVGKFVEKLQPVFHVRDLLVAYARGAAVVNGNVPVTGDGGVKAVKAAHITHRQHYAQVDALFVHAVGSGAASVHAAVAAVKDDDPGVGVAFGGVGVNGAVYLPHGVVYHRRRRHYRKGGEYCCSVLSQFYLHKKALSFHFELL